MRRYPLATIDWLLREDDDDVPSVSLNHPPPPATHLVADGQLYWINT